MVVASRDPFVAWSYQLYPVAVLTVATETGTWTAVLLMRCPSVELAGAEGIALTVIDPIDCEPALQAPDVPHRARRYSVVLDVTVTEGPYPSVVLVPAADVCQYQLTPAGGFVVRETMVEPQAFAMLMDVAGVPRFTVTDRLFPIRT